MLFRRFSRIAFPLLALTAGALMLSNCRGHHCGMGGSPEKHAEQVTKRIAKELDLTPEQKTKLESIKTAILARKSEFSGVHTSLQDVFMTQLRSGVADEAKLNQGFEDQDAKIKELRSFLVAEFVAFHGMLNVEQREKLATKLQEHCR
jgi:Spy/CpxP family protein refolding chaperone